MCHHHSMSMSHTHNAGSVAEPASDPKRILQVRYARGEITREQYLQMLADLTAVQPHPAHRVPTAETPPASLPPTAESA